MTDYLKESLEKLLELLREQEFSRSAYKNQKHFSTPAITNKIITYLENN